jgi:hypothetical protein
MFNGIKSVFDYEYDQYSLNYYLLYLAFFGTNVWKYRIKIDRRR